MEDVKKLGFWNGSSYGYGFGLEVSKMDHSMGLNYLLKVKCDQKSLFVTANVHFYQVLHY